MTSKNLPLLDQHYKAYLRLRVLCTDKTIIKILGGIKPTGKRAKNNQNKQEEHKRKNERMEPECIGNNFEYKPTKSPKEKLEMG